MRLYIESFNDAWASDFSIPALNNNNQSWLHAANILSQIFYCEDLSPLNGDYGAPAAAVFILHPKLFKTSVSGPVGGCGGTPLSGSDEAVLLSVYCPFPDCLEQHCPSIQHHSLETEIGLKCPHNTKYCYKTHQTLDLQG